MSALESTAERRGPTGLDRGAREAMLRVLGEGGIGYSDLMRELFRRDVYGSVDDYLATVERLDGAPARAAIEESMTVESEKRAGEIPGVDWERALRQAYSAFAPLGFLLAIPHRDFLTAVEGGVAGLGDLLARTNGRDALNRICERRGVPSRLNGSPAAFVYVGDAVIEETVLAPALSMLDHPRFRGGGVRGEFDDALKSLRSGTPDDLKRAVQQACNAVESAMKILLEAHSKPLPSKQNAHPLFEALESRGIVERDMDSTVLAPSRVGNNRARHGGGSTPKPVEQSEAEAVTHAAATAITFLGSRLPD